MVMRACSIELDDFQYLRYPLYASVKFDGIRGECTGSEVLSRKFISLPNKHVQNLFSHSILTDMEGEIIVGNTGEDETYKRSHSGIMSEGGEPDATIYLFDTYHDKTLPFEDRYAYLKSIESKLPEHCVVMEQVLINDYLELLAFEAKHYRENQEGIIIRYPDSLYKDGTATLKKGELLRFKRFADAEAEILIVNQLMRNLNKLEMDNLGHAKRSTRKAGKVPVALAGSLTVKDLKTGVVFNLSGLEDSDKEFYWRMRDNLEAVKYVKYKHFPYGSYKKPRFPSFMGPRDVIDII